MAGAAHLPPHTLHGGQSLSCQNFLIMYIKIGFSLEASPSRVGGKDRQARPTMYSGRCSLLPSVTIVYIPAYYISQDYTVSRLVYKEPIGHLLRRMRLIGQFRFRKQFQAGNVQYCRW